MLAPAPNAQTTCADGVVSASPGGRTVSASGTVAANADCAISADVLSSILGTYSNGAANFSAIGLGGLSVPAVLDVATLPTASIGGPPAGTSVAVGASIPLRYGCVAGSGTLAACAGTVTLPSGAVVTLRDAEALPTATPGQYTIVVTATDAFGRTITTTRTYAVRPNAIVAGTPPAPGATPPRPARARLRVPAARRSAGKATTSRPGLPATTRWPRLLPGAPETTPEGANQLVGRALRPRRHRATASPHSSVDGRPPMTGR